jgi:hypothetical protein
MLEQVIGTLTANLISSRTSSTVAVAGVPATVDLPGTFFVDALSLAAIGGLELPPALSVPSSIYGVALQEFEVRLDDGKGFFRAGDTHFAFVVPERAHEDVETIRQAHEAGVLSRRLLACLLMVDFPNPIFSTAREGLLKHVPEDLFDGDFEGFSERVAQSILDSAEADQQGTAESEFAANWEVGEAFEPAFNERLTRYYAALAERLGTQQGFNDYFRLAESHRLSMTDMPIVENRLLFAKTSVPPSRRRMTSAALVEDV